MAFQDIILPALKGKGFRQDDYWVWCGSVVEGDDSRYHMFAARWPKKYPFFHGYLAASEIVRASTSLYAQGYYSAPQPPYEKAPCSSGHMSFPPRKDAVPMSESC